MSAPDTNTEKQAVQHRGPLRGMALVVGFALVLLAALAFFVTSRGGSPEGADTQVDGRTGETAPAATGEGESGASANYIAADDAEASGSADATAVTVAPEQVDSVETGAGATADNEPGESQAAQSRDASPGDGEVEPEGN